MIKIMWIMWEYDIVMKQETECVNLPRVPTFRDFVHIQRCDEAFYSAVFSNGTFYSCTFLFTERYTLHVEIDGTVFPLAFALLLNKIEATYRRFFPVENRSHQSYSVYIYLNPEWIDFEVAVRNATNKNFPNTTIRGCFSHYIQCIWRKMQNCGLIRYACSTKPALANISVGVILSK